MADYATGMTSAQKWFVGIAIAALYIYVGLALLHLLPVDRQTVQKAGSETVDLDITTAPGSKAGETICKVSPNPLPINKGDFLRVDSDDGGTYTITFTNGSPLRGSPRTISSGSVSTIRVDIVGADTPFPYTVSDGKGCKQMTRDIGIIVGH